MKYTTTKKSPALDLPAQKAFTWLFAQLLAKHDISPVCEIRHAGKCGHCGRMLTTPESIDTGFGPECSKRLGVKWGKTGPRFEPLDFMTAGRAYFTVESKVTGQRFTYRVAKKKDDDESSPLFVSVLDGPDNWENYQYLGVIWL